MLLGTPRTSWPASGSNCTRIGLDVTDPRFWDGGIAVLAEMLSVGGEGIRARQALWRAVRETPPQVPEGPWATVLRQALDPQADRRHASARALAHALEEVTLRLGMLHGLEAAGCVVINSAPAIERCSPSDSS